MKQVSANWRENCSLIFAVSVIYGNFQENAEPIDISLSLTFAQHNLKKKRFYERNFRGERIIENLSFPIFHLCFAKNLYSLLFKIFIVIYIFQIENYVNTGNADNLSKAPLLVVGTAGAGKSALMAKSAHRATELVNEGTVKMPSM